MADGDRYSSIQIKESTERIPNIGWYVRDNEAEGDHELASQLIDGPYKSEEEANKKRDSHTNNLPKQG